MIRLLYNIKKQFLDDMIKKKMKSIGDEFDIVFPFKLIGGEYISIGTNFYLGKDSRLEAWDYYEGVRYNPDITIGNNVRVNGKCHIGAINEIVIGNNVLMGSGVFITDHSHGNVTSGEVDIPPTQRQLFSKGSVRIEDNVWIGENAVILPNVCVGYGSIIGANSVVTKDVPPRSVVVGNPARIVKSL